MLLCEVESDWSGTVSAALPILLLILFDTDEDIQKPGELLLLTVKGVKGAHWDLRDAQHYQSVYLRLSFGCAKVGAGELRVWQPS
jgi:hypothetical protein